MLPNQFAFGTAYAHNHDETKPDHGGDPTAPRGGLMPAPPPAMGTHPPLGALGGPHTPTHHAFPSWHGPPGAGLGPGMPWHATHNNLQHAPLYSAAPPTPHGGYGHMGGLTPFDSAHVYSDAYAAGGPG